MITKVKFIGYRHIQDGTHPQDYLLAKGKEYDVVSNFEQGYVVANAAGCLVYLYPDEVREIK